MLDRIFAVVSMLGVVAFLGVVLVSVRELDLIIVTVVVIGIAVSYFWQELKTDGSHLEDKSKGDKP